MNVPCVGVERGSALRQFKRHTTLCNHTLAGLYTLEQLHLHTIGGTHLYLALFKR